jgi:hypothetical protein
MIRSRTRTAELTATIGRWFLSVCYPKAGWRQTKGVVYHQVRPSRRTGWEGGPTSHPGPSGTPGNATAARRGEGARSRGGRLVGLCGHHRSGDPPRFKGSLPLHEVHRQTFVSNWRQAPVDASVPCPRRPSSPRPASSPLPSRQRGAVRSRRAWCPAMERASCPGRRSGADPDRRPHRLRRRRRSEAHPVPAIGGHGPYGTASPHGADGRVDGRQGVPGVMPRGGRCR